MLRPATTERTAGKHQVAGLNVVGVHANSAVDLVVGGAREHHLPIGRLGDRVLGQTRTIEAAATGAARTATAPDVGSAEPGFGSTDRATTPRAV